MASTKLVGFLCDAPEGDFPCRLNAVFLPNLLCNILTPRGRDHLSQFGIRAGHTSQAIRFLQGEGSFAVRDSFRLSIWLEDTGTSDTQAFYIPIDHGTEAISALLPLAPDMIREIHAILGRDSLALDWDAYENQDAPIYTIGLAKLTREASMGVPAVDPDFIYL
ncbi:hypothetical protein BP00DRAFT_160989 [Aspergillus indologenus CBS 114.80]|uniref:Uncharacterized protein n=1 Tax=Aspergillus indologenus CBS 114.80 TaxID=1450541 RepID=A0A2V5JAW2_9EURO|nr:hypothetical protein BP00DRAFT_160989 [Aspergillus indologenus CBS 114.80]